LKEGRAIGRNFRQALASLRAAPADLCLQSFCYRNLKVRESCTLRREREEQLTKPSAVRRRLPRPLSNGSINKMIRLLATILGQAVEYSYIDRNPAKGRKRLLRERKPTRTHLQPEQVRALLAAAGALDEADHGRRLPLFATLALSGLRISEALALRWRDVDLGEGKLWVAQAKTDADVREVDLTPRLQDILATHRRRTEHNRASDFVSQPGAADARIPQTFEIASSRRQFGAPTRNSQAPANESCATSPRTRCGGPMPRSCSSPEPTCPT
jgi:integrase